MSDCIPVSCSRSRSAFVLLLVMLATFTLASPGVAQMQVVLEPDRDATLIQRPAGNKANGKGSHFHVGMNENGGKRRALLHFDVESWIPVGSVVHSVDLTLRLTRTKVGPRRVSVHRVLKEWSEGPSHATSGEGGGADSMEGDATWKHAVYETEEWDTPGGDFDAGAIAALGVDRAGFYSFVDARMTADVQAWVNGDRSNLGILLLGKEDGEEVTSKRFASRESGTRNNRPVLTISFTPSAAEWCKRGTVDLGAGGVATDVLFVNSSTGAADRTVTLDIGDPIEVRLASPPAGPEPAHFVVYLQAGRPGLATVSPQPAGIGDLCFAGPLQAGEPVKIWNNLGHEAQLGRADYPSDPAPSILIDAPQGADRAAIVTLQGLMLDAGSAADVAASVTNAVVLDIR